MPRSLKRLALVAVLLAVGWASQATLYAALIDNLVAYWEFSSGSLLVDSHSNGYTLTNNNTAVGAAGVNGDGVDLETESGQYLTRATNANLAMGDVDFTAAAWVKLETSVVTAGIITKDDNSVDREWGIYTDGSGSVYCYAFSGVSGSGFHQAQWGSTLSTGTWYLVVCYHDATNDLIGISVNGNSTPVTTGHTGGVYAGSADFQVGRLGAGSTLDGVVDQVGVWRGRVLSTAEWASLYNSGSGRAYADLSGGGATCTGGLLLRRVGGC